VRSNPICWTIEMAGAVSSGNGRGGSGGRPRLFVLCYDVERAALRRRIDSALEHVGNRVQFSVFECWLSPAQSKVLFSRLEALLDPDDSLRMYCISASGQEHSRQSGGAPIHAGEDYWLL